MLNVNETRGEWEQRQDRCDRSVFILPSKSFTPANVITKAATNKSAIAKDARNKFPIRRRLRSVQIARHTRILPAIDKKINTNSKMPVKKEKKENCYSLTNKPSKRVVRTANNGDNNVT